MENIHNTEQAITDTTNNISMQQHRSYRKLGLALQVVAIVAFFSWSLLGRYFDLYWRVNLPIIFLSTFFILGAYIFYHKWITPILSIIVIFIVPLSIFGIQFAIGIWGADIPIAFTQSYIIIPLWILTPLLFVHFKNPGSKIINILTLTLIYIIIIINGSSIYLTASEVTTNKKSLTEHYNSDRMLGDVSWSLSDFYFRHGSYPNSLDDSSLIGAYSSLEKEKTKLGLHVKLQYTALENGQDFKLCNNLQLSTPKCVTSRSPESQDMLRQLETYKISETINAAFPQSSEPFPASMQDIRDKYIGKEIAYEWVDSDFKTPVTWRADHFTDAKTGKFYDYKLIPDSNLYGDHNYQLCPGYEDRENKCFTYTPKLNIY